MPKLSRRTGDSPSFSGRSGIGRWQPLPSGAILSWPKISVVFRLAMERRGIHCVVRLNRHRAADSVYRSAVVESVRHVTAIFAPIIMSRPVVKIVVRRNSTVGVNQEYYTLEQLQNAVVVASSPSNTYRVGDVLSQAAVQVFCDSPIRYAVTVNPPKP